LLFPYTTLFRSQLHDSLLQVLFSYALFLQQGCRFIAARQDPKQKMLNGNKIVLELFQVRLRLLNYLGRGSGEVQLASTHFGERTDLRIERLVKPFYIDIQDRKSTRLNSSHVKI